MNAEPVPSFALSKNHSCCGINSDPGPVFRQRRALLNKTGTCRIATKVGTSRPGHVNSEIDRLLHRCRAWLFRTLANALFDPYRPELHYMRGPGPKVAGQVSARAVTAMARGSHPLGQCTLLGELMDETHMRHKPWFWLIRLPFHGDRRNPWHGSEATREKAMEVFARSWHANRKKLPLPHPAQDQPHDGRAVKEGLFYVRWHTCADGSFEWYAPQWPYPAAREQILSDQSGGRSGAGEVAGEARAGQGASPQANAVTRTGPQNIAPAAPR